MHNAKDAGKLPAPFFCLLFSYRNFNLGPDVFRHTVRTHYHDFNRNGIALAFYGSAYGIPVRYS